MEEGKIIINDLVVKSMRNLDRFYQEIKELFLTINISLSNDYYYSTLNNCVIHESKTSLEDPQYWNPYYLSQIFRENSNQNNYLVVSIVFRALFGRSNIYQLPLDVIPIIFGKYINCKNVSALKWFNKDFVYSDDEKIQNARIEHTKRGESDDLFVIDGIHDFGFNRGLLYKTPLFQWENAEELVATVMKEIESLETMPHIKSGGK